MRLELDVLLISKLLYVAFACADQIRLDGLDALGVRTDVFVRTAAVLVLRFFA
jgi:hypothetical protein